jgi:hypothetical protein
VVRQALKPPPATVVKEQMRQAKEREKEAEAVEIQEVMNKITLYFDRFPGLHSKVKQPSARCSLAEAEECLAQIRKTMNSVGSTRAVAEVFNFALVGLERYWGDGTGPIPAMLPQPLRLNVMGISELFRAGKLEEFDPLIMEVDIEYPWIGSRGLMMRILDTMKTAMMKVHVINTSPEARAAFLAKARPTDVGADGDDL